MVGDRSTFQFPFSSNSAKLLELSTRVLAVSSMAEESKTEVSATVDMEVDNPNSDPRDEENDANSKSVEEQRMEKADPVSLGPKIFGSGVEMVDYFSTFLQNWQTNLDVNKYEHLVLLDLLKKGHPEPDTKIGGGVGAFQVRFHMNRRCFFLIKEDQVVDDFSFIECVDRILPLPEDIKAKLDVNGTSGGGKGHGRRGLRGRRW